MERMVVDEVTLEYEVAGSPAGEPVVFIHGAFIADTFRPMLAEPPLAGRYRLIAYHRRGYVGSTGSHAPISISRQAADCLGLLERLDALPAHVVGHSLGGCVALQLALDAPHVVASLALLEPGLFVGDSAASYREALLRSGQRYREVGAAATVDEFFRARWPGYHGRLDQVLPGAFEQAVADAATVFEQDSGQLDWQFGEAEARRISQPALVVLGGDSPALHPRFEETNRLLLEWLPNVEGFVLPGTTHLMQVENPVAMAEALASFLARHPLR